MLCLYFLFEATVRWLVCHTIYFFLTTISLFQTLPPVFDCPLQRIWFLQWLIHSESSMEMIDAIWLQNACKKNVFADWLRND